MTSVSLPDEVRAACAWVAERARSVRVDEEAIAEYAGGLPQPDAADEPAPFANTDHGGRFLGPAEAAESIPDLAAIFATWTSFADVSTYEGRQVPFYKRAQLAAAGLHRANVADRPGLDCLTAFADNLVPHVLRVDGVLHLDPALTAQIEAEELLEHGSPEEVELRACAVQAVELLAAASPLTSAQIDSALWNRGRDRRYKSLPRPRSRNSAY